MHRSFAFFGNAMTIFCLILHVILDLNPEIVNALYSAKDRVYAEMNSRGGNYGLDDKRSNLPFMLVLTVFIAEINRAYMLAFAERICKHFAEHGTCMYGSRCRHSHEPPAAKL